MSNGNGQGDAAQPQLDWQAFFQQWWAAMLAATPYGWGSMLGQKAGAKVDWLGLGLAGLGVLLVVLALVMFMSEETAKRIRQLKSSRLLQGVKNNGT